VRPVPINNHDSHLQRFTENTENFIKNNPAQDKTNPIQLEHTRPDRFTGKKGLKMSIWQ